MSRMIDADALFKEMEKTAWYDNADRDEVAEELVMNAPTIEPERKTGRWKDYPIADGCIQCSVCGVLRMGEPSNYCPNCGAEMEVEHDTDNRKE